MGLWSQCWGLSGGAEFTWFQLQEETRTLFKSCVVTCLEDEVTHGAMVSVLGTPVEELSLHGFSCRKRQGHHSKPCVFPRPLFGG